MEFKRKLEQVVDSISGGAWTRRNLRRRIEEYAVTGEHHPSDGQLLVDAFVRSGGPWLTEAARVLSKNRPHYDFDAAEDVLHLWERPGAFESSLDHLNDHGWAILEAEIPAPIVSELSNFFANSPCLLTSDADLRDLAHEQHFVTFDNPLAEKYQVETNHLIQNELVRRLMLDQGLLKIAQAYCGAVPSIDIAVAWYSFPKERASANAGQLFHFDLDRVRWLKAFLLLSDQDLNTGAHTYVPGSHRDGAIPRKLLKHGYTRLRDDQVAEVFPESEWTSMTAKKGRILLEDTRGLHKGLAVKRDYRLMLQFEYASSMFGGPCGLEELDLTPVQDAYWINLRQKYPELFVNFPA